MSIYGISGNSNYSYQNMLNLMRLSSMSKLNSSSAVNPIERVSKTTSKTSAYADVTSFLKDYQSELTKLESAASKLQGGNRQNVFTDYEVASSDENVATAKKVYGLKAGTDITLDVQATAQAQKNASTSHYSQEEVEAGADMNLQIATSSGSYNISVSSRNENGTQKTYDQMYKEAASAINANSGSGVKASVENVDGRVSLVLTSDKTGASNGFTVSGDMGAAQGLSNAAVQARDAEYTVTQDGFTQTLRSETNTISLDYGRVEAELKGEGQSKIYTGVDTDKVASAVQDLVDSYNSVTSLLNKNADRGVGATAHMQSFNRGMADEKTLEAIGITYDKDGKMVLDKEKLTSALEEDFEWTQSAISGQFGIAQKAAQKAESALSDSVQRVVSDDLASASKQSQSFSSSDSFQYFSNFARSGPYNLGNYYTVGMLLNTLA